MQHQSPVAVGRLLDAGGQGVDEGGAGSGLAPERYIPFELGTFDFGTEPGCRAEHGEGK